MGHPDFRVGGKVFATLGYPKQGWAMVRLSLDEQEHVIKAHPQAFSKAKGAWGNAGCTMVELLAATKAVGRPALESAWRERAPKRLVRALDER